MISYTCIPRSRGVVKNPRVSTFDPILRSPLLHQLVKIGLSSIVRQHCEIFLASTVYYYAALKRQQNVPAVDA